MPCNYFGFPPGIILKEELEINSLEIELDFQRSKGTPESLLEAGIESIENKKKELRERLKS